MNVDIEPTDLPEIARVTVAMLNACSRVPIPIPEIRCRRVSGSWYYPKNRHRSRAHITIAKSSHSRNMVQALAHELAHHLAYCLAPKGERGHGEFFFRCLLTVIEAMGLDSYNWGTEYASLRKRASKRSHK